MFEIDRKQPLTIANLIQIALIIFGLGGLYVKFTNVVEAVALKADQTAVNDLRSDVDKNAGDISDFKNQNIVYRLGLQEQAIVAGDQRQTRAIDSMIKRSDDTNKKIDTLVESVNEFKTDTKVLSTEVKGLSATVKELSASPKRMRFSPSASLSRPPLPAAIAH